MKTLILLCAGALLASIAAPSALASSNYTCTVFNFGTAASTTPTGINNKGQVVGTWATADQPYSPHAFLRNVDGTMKTLTAPNGSDAFAPVGINNLGQIAGQIVTGTSPFTVSESFILNPDGTHTDIAPAVAPPGHTYTSPQITGINDKGELAGTIGLDFNVSTYIVLVFIRGTDGTYKIIDQGVTAGSPLYLWAGSLNNSDVVVEHARNMDGFLLQPNGSKIPLEYPGLPAFAEPGLLPTHTNGLNNNNVTAGSLQPELGSGGASIAFLHTLDGHYPDIVCPEADGLTPHISGASDFIQGVNDQNVVIGRYGSAAFIATPTGLAPHAELSNTSWTFASHGIGETSGLGRIFIGNSGTADLHIPAIYSGPAVGQFQITQTNCGNWDSNHQDMMKPGTIPPGGSCFLEFTFTPRSPGWQTSSIYIPDDSPTSPEMIQLGGTGVGGMLQLSNSSWTFAAHRVGETSGNGVVYAYNAGLWLLPLKPPATSRSRAAHLISIC
jgi:probable HAF family extracellular repeat protein